MSPSISPLTSLKYCPVVSIMTLLSLSSISKVNSPASLVILACVSVEATDPSVLRRLTRTVEPFRKGPLLALPDMVFEVGSGVMTAPVPPVPPSAHPRRVAVSRLIMRCSNFISFSLLSCLLQCNRRRCPDAYDRRYGMLNSHCLCRGPVALTNDPH